MAGQVRPLYLLVHGRAGGVVTEDLEKGVMDPRPKRQNSLAATAGKPDASLRQRLGIRQLTTPTGYGLGACAEKLADEGNGRAESQRLRRRVKTAILLTEAMVKGSQALLDGRRVGHGAPPAVATTHVVRSLFFSVAGLPWSARR